MKLDPVSRYAIALGPPPKLKKSAIAVAQAIRSTPPARVRSDLTASAGTQADEIQPRNSLGSLERLAEEAYAAASQAIMAIGPPVPNGWIKGQLLNVRNNGSEYVVTILGEEFDPRYPERALKFDSSFSCQAFISKWYARECHDPRAF